MRRRRPAATLDAQGDLRLERVRKDLGGATVVHGLDLTVPDGSFFALLGPSGCGKTTTLRMVAGLERPTAGRVLIGGTDLTDVPAHQRPVNTVFQSYALFPHLSVRDNVAFGPRRRGVPDAAAQAERMLDLVQLAHLAGQRPARLSGGQQQRVALARALVNRPRVLLLDEPLGALDLALRRQMQVELKRIQTRVGLTFVHVTHDQEEAMTMADTVAVMNAGRIEQIGPPAGLYDLPRTAFVAGFLGRSNLAAGEAVVDGGQVLLDAGGTRLPVPAERATHRSGPALLGVRPEKLVLHRDDPGPATGRCVAGPVPLLDVSFTGVATDYLVAAPHGPGTWSVHRQNLDLGGDEPRPGEEVWVSWQSGHAFLVPDPEDAPDAVADPEPEAGP